MHMIGERHPKSSFSPAVTDDAQADIASRLLGTWRMLSWTTEDLVTGETVDALGANPEGYITYTADGRVMVLVLRGDRKMPAELVPTNEEKVALYDSMFAYAGTYSVDHEKVVHHIDMSWNQSWTGNQPASLSSPGRRQVDVHRRSRQEPNERSRLRAHSAFSTRSVSASFPRRPRSAARTCAKPDFRNWHGAADFRVAAISSVM